MASLRSSAFTLIELLAVIAIITLLVGGFGLAGRDSDRGGALLASQNTVASLLDTARNQAICHQSRAVLVINADPAADGFLRMIHVAIESGPDSGQWTIEEEGSMLPRGIFVVPGSDAMAGVEFADGWPSSRRSALQLAALGSVSGDTDNASGRYLCLMVPLSAGGTPAGEGGAKFILSAGQRTPTAVRFDRPTQLRGLVLSSYGMAIKVNDASGFDF